MAKDTRGGIRRKAETSVSLVGKTVSDLFERYMGAKENLIKDFGLQKATTSQINSLMSVFRGMNEHDRQYGDDKRPYIVERIEISMLGSYKTEEDLQRERELFGKNFREPKVAQVWITTKPNSGNDYLDMLDTKDRLFLIGANGGYYTYNNAGKRTSIKSFDALYGKRRG